MEQLYYISRWLYVHRVPILPKIVMMMIRLLYQSFIPYRTKIGPGVSFGHKQGIMIAPRATIGARCKIRHQVTIAGSSNGAATIGDDVQIGAGAKILGAVHIGNGALIGANAVVVKDVPDGAVIVGIPAKVVRIQEQSNLVESEV